MGKDPYVLGFNQTGIKDVGIVGGKNASLGEMYVNLTSKGLNVPNGFSITAYAYTHFLESSKLTEKMKKILSGLNTYNLKSLQQKGKEIRQLISTAKMPEDLRQDIVQAYQDLCKEYKQKNVDVAVRSSATAEDLPDASFAGQQETFLNIRGEKDLIEACKKCFASLFTDRAISYRVDKGFDHFSVKLSIGVQKMVRSDKGSSGVMFTIDSETGFKDVVFVTSAYGLGENVVQGTVNPDEFYIFKPTLKKGFKAIISKKLGSKKMRMVYDAKGTKNTKVAAQEQCAYSLTDPEVLKLAEWGCIIEEHYSAKHSKYTPMDIEWGKDGVDGKLYILQARPETVHSQKQQTTLEKYNVKKEGTILVSGKSVGERIGVGKGRVILDLKNINNFKKGEVLITDMTSPDWEPVMKIASAIVTNRGGRTCHAAIISREFGIPCVVGTNNATEKIKDGQNVTVDCSKGTEGYVYDGILEFEIKKIDLTNLPKLPTKIMMNIGIPEQAFAYSSIPNEGVGLARLEFIINSHIQIHPLALLKFDQIKDKALRDKISSLTSDYKDKSQYFIDKLAQSVALISAAFYPKDVIVRLSDFKSNEYSNLIGGKLYEPQEENPMIGWRGASRYYSPNYREGFALECKALKKAREEMGFTNIKAMIPFVRTVKEGQAVVDEMKKNSLKQGENGLEIYMMCEVPSNVILADKFFDIFDGFSIGSNDLTQLTLGLDRDSAIISSIYDERNDAVKKLISDVINVAKAKKKKIGICGDAPSTFPDFAKFLMDCGIDSMSLTPDAVLKTIMQLSEKK
ncbi:phosphoenolpyruvate synthase [Candidatus Woesearchaeota archaeon]|nr:phosphoenolpyruvate synthase [Candidatus Woesearchaeota archaeon]